MPAGRPRIHESSAAGNAARQRAYRERHKLVARPVQELGSESERIERLVSRLLSVAEMGLAEDIPSTSRMITAGIAIDKMIALRSRVSSDKDFAAVDEWLRHVIGDGNGHRE